MAIGIDPETRQRRANLPASERQMIAKNIFVDHDGFKNVTAAIGEYHMPVVDGVPDYGVLSVVAGEPRTGKSFALERYADRFAVGIGASGVLRRVVYVDMPLDCNLRAMAEQIADQLNLTYSQSMNTRSLIKAVLAELKDQEVEFLILDEFQEVFDVSRKKTLKDARAFLRKILNLRSLNVCVAGLLDTYRLLAEDKQLKGRGLLPHHIVAPYDWEERQSRMDFRLLCDFIDEGLPFKLKSGMGSAEFAQRLYYVTDGIIGLLIEFVYAAACKAINAGTDAIEMRFFAEAWDQRKPIGIPFNPFIDDMSKAPPKVSPPSAPTTSLAGPAAFSMS